MKKQNTQQQKQQKQAATAKAIKNAKARARKKERKKILGGRSEMNQFGQRDARFALSWDGGGISDTPWGSVSVGNFGLQTDGFGKGKARSSGSMVGLGERTDDIQVVLPRIVPGKNAKGLPIDVCFGTEYLSTISNNVAGSAPGDILASLLISPSNFQQTRLIEFAKLYQRYRFRKLNFWYKPTANSIQSGQLIGYGDYDPDNVLEANSPDNIGLAAAHIGQATGKIWESICFPFGILDDYTTLFVDSNSPERRLSFQGVYYLLAASDIESDIGPLGNLYIEYEVEFSIPLLQSSALDVEGISVDGTAGLTLDLPFGTAQAITVPSAIPNLPQTPFDFSDVSDQFDFYMDPIDGKMENHVALEGDLWLHQVLIQFAATGTNADAWGPATDYGFVNSCTYTGCSSSNMAGGLDPVSVIVRPNAGFVVNTSQWSASWTNLLRVTDPLSLSATFNLGKTGLGTAYQVNLARQVWIRLHKGIVAPGMSGGIPKKFSLEGLRKREAHLRRGRKLLSASRHESTGQGVSFPDYQEYLKFFRFQKSVERDTRSDTHSSRTESDIDEDLEEGELDRSSRSRGRKVSRDVRRKDD